MSQNESTKETEKKKRLPTPDVKSLPAKLRSAKVSKAIKRGALCVVAGAIVAGVLYYASMPDTVKTQAAVRTDIAATVKLNTSYQQDDYNAAVNQNNKYRTKLDEALSGTQSSRALYEQTKVSIDAIDASEHGKTMDNQGDQRSYEKQIGTLSTDLETANSEFTAAETAYDDARIELASIQGELDDYDKKIASTQATKTQKGAAWTAAEETALEQLKAERASVQSKYDRVKTERDKYESQKNSIKNSVNSLKDEIEKKRRKIADMDLTGLSKQEYEQYQALLRQLDLIERDWQQSITAMNTADEHLVDAAKLTQYQDSVKIAKLEQDAAGDRLSKAKDDVTADIAGTITKRFIDNGAVVEAGAPLFEIQPLSGYKATVMISRFDIGSIKLGQKADVVVGSAAYTGTVSAISPVAETDASGKPKVKVDISLDDADAAPTIGLEAEIVIHVDEKKDVLTVPAEAVYTGDDGDYVYLLNAGIAEKRSFERGLSGDGKVEVKSGVKDGELVVTSIMTDDDIGTKYTTEE